ncbi:MAG TPA: nucleotidyl transferase AbiEii/AbiGii toxin family protein, partial [Vicinamibacterales bacterium]|nr:nucleotidyl transferase AbiEii/AbiGii toxin family protein [Vicinamibacterales bacterium]
LLVPLERQVAEKLHAFTRTYKGGGTTRGRDLVDLLLILKYERVDETVLKNVIRRVFDRRATHPAPERLPPPPPDLAVSYRREAEPVGVASSIEEAYEVLRVWLDPVLAKVARTDADNK